MITYGLRIKKEGDVFTVTSPQFSNTVGYGPSELIASQDFFSKLSDVLNLIIFNKREFPTSIRIEQMKRKTINEGSFRLPINVELTMLLHTIMMGKSITKSQLANMLALTEDDINSTDWQLEKISRLKSKLPAKYKKVQRLLDVRHDSTIDAMTEAFRVLDCFIDLTIVAKNSFERESIAEI